MHSFASGSQVQEFYDTFKLFDEDKDDRLSLKDKLESSRQICATNCSPWIISSSGHRGARTC
jgi:Ca2+-binding EF-hand superfamily protein